MEVQSNPDAREIEAATSNELIGKLAYLAYRLRSRGVSLVSGQALPEWEGLNPEIRDAWVAAGAAVQLATYSVLCEVADRLGSTSASIVEGMLMKYEAKPGC